MKKIYVSLLLSLVLVIALTSFVSSTDVATLISPTTGSTVTGIVNLTSTVNNSGVGFNISYYYVYSAGLTGNLTGIVVSRMSNITGNTTMMNSSFNSATFEDGNDYIFYVVVSNGTTNLTSASLTGITIANTVPTAPSALSPATNTIDTDGSVNFTVTVVGRETTSCIMYFPKLNPGLSSYSMTHSGEVCTRSFTGVPQQSYDWYVIASDETNTTSSATVLLNVKKNTGSSGRQALVSEAKNGGSKPLSFVSLDNFSNIQWYVWMIIVLSVVGVIWLIKRK